MINDEKTFLTPEYLLPFKFTFLVTTIKSAAPAVTVPV